MKMIKLLPFLSLMIAAAYWLPRVLRWILEPDMDGAFVAIERKIDEYLRELVTPHSPTGKNRE